MVKDPRHRDAAVRGMVDWFDVEDGWGALTAPEVPGGCFVHYSNIQSDGYRQLVAGQEVRFTYSEPAKTATPSERSKCGRTPNSSAPSRQPLRALTAADPCGTHRGRCG
jgi:CspA family cold shock protein